MNRDTYEIKLAELAMAMAVEKNPAPVDDHVFDATGELIPFAHVPVGSFVSTFLQARMSDGKKKHGRFLQAFDGRDTLADALQEVGDALQYLSKAAIEREYNKHRLRELAGLLRNKAGADPQLLTIAAAMERVIEQL